MRWYKVSLQEMEAPVGIEPTMAELQSTALPLCYGALEGISSTDLNIGRTTSAQAGRYSRGYQQ